MPELGDKRHFVSAGFCSGVTGVGLFLQREQLGQSQGDKMRDLSPDVSRVAFSFARGGKASVWFNSVVFGSPAFAVTTLGCSRGGKNLTQTWAGSCRVSTVRPGTFGQEMCQ